VQDEQGIGCQYGSGIGHGSPVDAGGYSPTSNGCPSSAS
jgi:hypothetical protein